MVEEELASAPTTFFYTWCIVSLIVLVIEVLIFLNFLYASRIRQNCFCNTKDQHQNPTNIDNTSFILCCIMFLSSIGFSFIVTFVRSNYISSNKHLLFGCHGYHVLYYMSSFAITKLCIVLICNYRLYLIFDNSVFAYPTWLLIRLGLFLFGIWIVGTILGILSTDTDEVKYYWSNPIAKTLFNNKNEAYLCGFGTFTFEYKTILYVYGVSFAMAQFILCSLFVYKLHKLNLMLFSQYK